MSLQLQDNERELQKLLSMWIKIEDAHDQGKVSDEVYNAFMQKYILEDKCKHEWYAYTGDEDVSGVCIICKETYRV